VPCHGWDISAAVKGDRSGRGAGSPLDGGESGGTLFGSLAFAETAILLETITSV
jgi:hypothetical protein